MRTPRARAPATAASASGAIARSRSTHVFSVGRFSSVNRYTVTLVSACDPHNRQSITCVDDVVSVERGHGTDARASLYEHASPTSAHRWLRC